MTAFRTHAAALVDRVRCIGRGSALAQRRRRARDATDLYECERMLDALDILRDLQRAEEQVIFGEGSPRAHSARQVADGARGACQSRDRREAVAGPIATRPRDGSPSAPTRRRLGTRSAVSDVPTSTVR